MQLFTLLNTYQTLDLEWQDIYNSNKTSESRTLVEMNPLNTGAAYRRRTKFTPNA